MTPLAEQINLTLQNMWT